MHPVRKQRLMIVIFIVVFSSVAVGLMAYALRENINLFYPPSKIASGDVPHNTRIRAGGDLACSADVYVQEAVGLGTHATTGRLL